MEALDLVLWSIIWIADQVRTERQSNNKMKKRNNKIKVYDNIEKKTKVNIISY